MQGFAGVGKQRVPGVGIVAKAFERPPALDKVGATQNLSPLAISRALLAALRYSSIILKPTPYMPASTTSERRAGRRLCSVI